MATTYTRAQFRQHIGRALGRNWYDSSTVAAGCTANKLVDPKRTERAAFWDGASVKVGTEEVYARGGGGSINTGSGMIYLDRDLAAGAPSAATAYEILKGWTFADVDEAIEDAHTKMYPLLYTPVRGVNIIEVANQLDYDAPTTWTVISRVFRERVQNASPAWFDELYDGHDYHVTLNGLGGLVLVLHYTPEAGTDIRVEGRGLLTIAAGDASTSIAPWQVVVPGALAYLFDKGINADAMNASLRQSFDAEAQRQQGLFELAKVQFKMKVQTRRASFPIITEVNNGTTVLF